MIFTVILEKKPGAMVFFPITKISDFANLLHFLEVGDYNFKKITYCNSTFCYERT